MAHRINLALLIDDEKIDQRQYTRVLRKSGIVDEVMPFTYADAALTHLRENPDLPVDVIFLDINMPRMSGFEFLDIATRELGSTLSSVVVAMLTTSLNPEDHRRAESYAAVKEFINKPLQVDHIQCVATHLSGAT